MAVATTATTGLSTIATLRAVDEVPVDFDDLYRRYHRRVRGFVRRKIADAHLVDDVVQDVFLRVFRSLDSLDPERDPWPWLVKVADNAVVDAMRRRRPAEELREAVVEGRSTLVRHSDDPSERFTARQRREGIATAMGAVCDRQRRMLMLRETEGWPYEDIAKFEGITLDALKSALKRARKSFRDAYATLADQRGLWGAALAPFSAAARRVRSAMSRAEVQLAAPLAGLASSLSGQVASLMVVAGIATASVGAGSAPINPSLASASHSEAASATTAPARSAASSSAPPGVPGADGRRVSLRMPSDQLTGRQPATASPGADVDADGEYMSLVTEVVIHITGQSDAYVGPDVWIDCNGSRTTRATCDAMGSAPNG